MAFGQKYKKHPTPKWTELVTIVVDWMFMTIAGGALLIPDEWMWWKYVTAGSAALAILWGRIKNLFGITTDISDTHRSIPESYKTE